LAINDAPAESPNYSNKIGRILPGLYVPVSPTEDQETGCMSHITEQVVMLTKTLGTK